MSAETPSHRIRSIHVDLNERSVVFNSDDKVVVRLSFEDAGLMLHGLASPEPGPISAHEAGEGTETSEKEEAQIISGRLRAVPRDGRPDRKGRPTAWAPFLAFPTEEGSAARSYAATFYGAAAPIVLSLGKGANVTVRGFVRESNDPVRDDWLSVVGFLNWPGKPVKPADSPAAPETRIEEGGEEAE